ncbi:unnamed protein product [Strongylus vulgaris]|uniref:Uncharacterized protein n=1 Tax=Strongylus vulgaris TaxID=40348 RepID=A0A3P7JJZ1_STRVU|nr:unnamed protein product [Strongylus vulgaris]
MCEVYEVDLRCCWCPKNLSGGSSNATPGRRLKSEFEGSSKDEEPSIDVLIANAVPHKYFPAVIVQCLQANGPVLVYNLPNTDCCYTFCHAYEKGLFDVYICKGCYIDDNKEVSVLVYEGYFQWDPATLPHNCSPKEFAIEISLYTHRHLRLPQAQLTVLSPNEVQAEQSTPKRKPVQRGMRVTLEDKDDNERLVNVINKFSADRCLLLKTVYIALEPL